MFSRRSLPLPRVLVTVCALAAASFGQGAAAKQALQPAADSAGYVQMATAIGDDYFDGKDSVERVRRHLQVAREAGVRYLRCAFSWNGIEPEQGQYHFEFWDKLVDEAARAGIEVIPYVAYTPEWAASTEKEFWKQPPRQPELFASIMRTLAERYRGKIHSWELWNEPDNLEYWTGTPDEFAATMIAGARAVREADPTARLVLGGISFGPSSFFDTLVTKHHLERYFDVIAQHAYPESWQEQRAEEVFEEWIPAMFKVAQPAGRTLWLNEMGYADYRYAPAKASLYGTNAFYKYEHTRDYAADFLFKSCVMTLASGQVALAGWYRIDDFSENDPRMPADKVHYHLGVTDRRGKRKPAFYALKFFNMLFAQPVRVLKEPENGAKSQAEIRVFQRKDSKVIVTAWLRSSEYSEVPKHSGMERDRRRERVNVALPCRAATVQTFDAQGKRRAETHPRAQVMQDVELTGDRVFIAEVSCEARPN